MKRRVITLAAITTLVTVALRAQSPPTPGPEHRKLQIWVGDWTYEGDIKATPLGPAGKASGKVSVRSALGGFFVEWNGEDNGPWGTTRWHEIDGYNPATKKHTWNLFASDGGSQTVSYTIDGANIVYAGTQITGGKEYQIRGTVAFTPDLTSNVEKREFSADGQTWMPLWETRSTKSKSSPR